MSIAIAPCPFCKHLIDGRARTCAAFPEGIPNEITSGANDHTSPVEGDNGIQFEQASGKTNYADLKG